MGRSRLVGLFVLLAVMVHEPLHALDLRFFGGGGNLSFDSERETPLGLEGKRFEPSVYPFGRISLEGEYSTMVDYTVSFERDPVLRNRMLASAGFTFGFLRLEFGPFMGLFNTGEQAISPGVTAALGIEFPGILFGSLQGASTIGSLALFPGDFIQETGEIAVGFWVPYVICAFSISDKSFTERKTGDLLVKDEHTRYQFRADVFTKNVPYTVRVNLGYQSLKRSYSPEGKNSETDELKSIYAGFEGTYQFTPAFQFILGAEMPVYVWGEKPLKGPERTAVMYQCHAGFVWTLPGMNRTPAFQ
ncbi:MAG: hypothetical protein LBE14_00140 [Treponema sp.]|jgi:hypothetical protein|nr:hypothetical protein [Treponema sp.]